MDGGAFRNGAQQAQQMRLPQGNTAERRSEILSGGVQEYGAAFALLSRF
jgi:hypothetical protein